MSIRHRIVQGECLASVAAHYGWLPDLVWNHDDNKDLKKLRGDPDVLFPDDILVIPDPREKLVEKPTDKLHVFRRKGIPHVMTITLMNLDQPMKNLRYTIEVDGVAAEGTTDGQGVLKHRIPPKAKKAVIRVEDGSEFEMDLGHLDPVTEVSGVQGRLLNLGFYQGPINNQLDEATVLALKSFQNSHSLEVTGTVNDETKAKLTQLFGS